MMAKNCSDKSFKASKKLKWWGDTVFSAHEKLKQWNTKCYVASLYYIIVLLQQHYMSQNVLGPESVWFQTYLIPNSDSELVLFGIYLILKLSHSKPLWFRPYLSQNLFDSQPIWFWANLILNLSDFKPIFFWTYLILSWSLSESSWFQTWGCCIAQCPSLSSILRWLPTSPSMPCDAKLATKQEWLLATILPSPRISAHS